jgi:CHAT domain-containing protein
MRTILIFFCCFLLSNSIQAQDNLSDLTIHELDSIAWGYYEAGAYAKSIPYFKEIIPIAKEEGLDSFYIQVMTNLGDVYGRAGQTDKAQEIYLVAIKKCEETLGKEHFFYAMLLDLLSNVYVEKGFYKQAKDLIVKSLTIHKKVFGEKHPRYANCVSRMGMFYYKLSKYEESLPFFLQAQEINKETQEENQTGYARSLNNVASLYQVMGRLEEAEDFYKQSIEIYRVLLGDKHPTYAALLNNMAQLYRSMGRYEEAKPLFLEILNILKESLGEEHFRYATSLNNLGMLYVSLKQYEKAENLLLESNRIRKLGYGDQSPIYSAGLNNLASLYQDMKRYKEAETLLLKSTKIRKSILGEQNLDYAQSLNNLAVFYTETKEYEKAEGYSLKALEIQKKIIGEEHITYVRCLGNLAIIYKSMNRYEEAIKVSLQGIEANCKSDLDNSKGMTDYIKQIPSKDFLSKKELITTLQKSYQISKGQYKHFKDKKYLKEAYAILQATIEISEQVRNDFASEQSKLRILSETSKTVSKAIATGLELKEAVKQEELFVYAELNKSILLADATKSQRARAISDLPDSLALKEMTLMKRKSQLKKSKHEAKDPQSKATALHQENELNSEINDFVELIEEEYPKYHALKYENIIASVEDVQKHLDDKSLMIEYFVANKTTYLFAISKKNVKTYSITISKDSLNEQVQRLRKSLTDYEFLIREKNKSFSQYSESAHWFYNNFLRVALNDKNVKNLIIIADGELGHLPFEAFLTKKTSQDKVNYTNLSYLVNDYNISYNYSATLWKENLETPVQISNNKMLACASTYYSNDTSSAGLREPHIVKLRKILNPLPATKTEVEVLSEMFQGDFLSGTDVNEAFLKEHAHEYGIIHLAMHGLLHPRVPILSSLALTENKDSTEDNFLQAFEIAHLDLNADLVVLSACQTGFGEFEQGEGVMSLARSFMYAGVPSLVVSLWQVNDASTAIIMKYFYQELADGLDKSTALRQAKLNYIEHADGIAAHPAFWSPFIQLGDNRPIQIGTKGGLLKWFVGIFLLLVILGVGFYFLKKNKKEVVST